MPSRPSAPCSAQKKQQEQLVAGVTVGVAAMMAHPLVAEAAVTPSLKNLLNSLVAGGLVLGAIVLAITGVSNVSERALHKGDSRARTCGAQAGGALYVRVTAAQGGAGARAARRQGPCALCSGMVAS